MTHLWTKTMLSKPAWSMKGIGSELKHKGLTALAKVTKNPLLVTLY